MHLLKVKLSLHRFDLIHHIKTSFCIAIDKLLYQIARGITLNFNCVDNMVISLVSRYPLCFYLT